MCWVTTQSRAHLSFTSQPTFIYTLYYILLYYGLIAKPSLIQASQPFQDTIYITK